MHCEKFEARLQDVLDQRQSPQRDEALVAHAAACDQCRELLAVQERLFAGLSRSNLPRMSPSFAAAIVAEVLADDAKPTVVAARSRWNVWSKVGAGVLAASVVVAIALATRPDKSPNVSPVPNNVVVAPPAEKTTPNTTVVAHNDKPTEPPGEKKLMQFVKSADELLDPRQTGRMIREVTTSFPSVPTAAEGRIPGYRPVANSLSMTMGMVRRTLPGGRDSSRTNDKAPPSSKPQAEYSTDDLLSRMV